jgi:AcrR family transcriptional regulator
MTRQLLLRKALELFDAKGYASTTVDDIAAAADTTRTTFYAHFPSKAHLMQALIQEANGILTGTDSPPLPAVVSSGERKEIKAWLARKFDQWAAIRPYVIAGHQAAAVDPDIQAALDRWFDETVEEMRQGLDQAGRFDPATRRDRCLLAFGGLEFLSRRWMRLGWDTDGEQALDLLTDTWCHLLADQTRAQ